MEPVHWVQIAEVTFRRIKPHSPGLLRGLALTEGTTATPAVSASPSPPVPSSAVHSPFRAVVTPTAPPRTPYAAAFVATCCPSVAWRRSTKTRRTGTASWGRPPTTGTTTRIHLPRKRNRLNLSGARRPVTPSSATSVTSSKYPSRGADDGESYPPPFPACR